jgi:LPXTG-motif cell wall-anchored protein
MSRAPTETIAADLGGKTLTSGVYNSTSTILLTGALTLDGQGDADATFIFQAGSALTTMSGSSISLTNGAQACNVFWVVGSSATLGTGSRFVGTVMALESITDTTNASVDGRLLARNGTVTLDSNTIVNNAYAEPAIAVPGDDSTGDSPGDDSTGDSTDDDSTGDSTDDDSTGDVTEETPGEDSVAPAPAPAPGEETIDGGVLPNTGGIEWLVVAVAGLALAAAGTVAYLRLGRGRHGRP